MQAKPLATTAQGKPLGLDTVFAMASAAVECQKTEQGRFEPVK